jgi:hypothetical protein
LNSPRLSSVTGDALRGAASRLRGARRYLPLSIALSFVLIHDLGGAGHRAAPVSSAIASAPMVKSAVIQRQQVAPVRRDALPAHPAASHSSVMSGRAQVHPRRRVIYRRRVAIAPPRPAVAASTPARSPVTPSVTRSTAPAASTATGRAPSEHRAEFGFEN